MIKTLIFDLGGVVVPLDFARAYGEIAAHSPHPPEEIRRRIAASDLYVRSESGRIEAPDFIREMSRLLDLEVDAATFRRIWCSVFPPRTLIEDDLMKQLHERCRILLLSNTNAVHFEWIRENYPILRHFDGFILSYRVGHMKPAPEIYRAAIQLAGCRPRECYFTDDFGVNVEGALREGLDAVEFVSSERLRVELTARGVL